jgi:hypothetical protein
MIGGKAFRAPDPALPGMKYVHIRACPVRRQSEGVSRQSLPIHLIG